MVTPAGLDEFSFRSVVIADPDVGDRLPQIGSAVTDHNVQIQMAARALFRRQLTLAEQQGRKLCVMVSLAGRKGLEVGTVLFGCDPVKLQHRTSHQAQRFPLRAELVGQEF